MALGFVLTSINSFQSLGLSLLASAGAVTVVLGFAAREVLGNILASVQIALNRSARIGDQLIEHRQRSSRPKGHSFKGFGTSGGDPTRQLR